MNEHLLKAALAAAADGWAVIPLRPGDKRPALHGEASCPAIGDCAGGHRKWEQRATTDPDRIRAAWSHSAFNVGVATGPSGLVVIDLDLPKTKNNSNADTPCGVTTFQALCERTDQPLPTTRTVRTASGGVHLYFTAPAGARLGNTAGKLAPLIDTRAWGGYVVGTGSITATGCYEVIDTAPVAVLPEWLLGLLQPQAPRKAGPLRLPAVSGSRAAQAALERECVVVSGAPDKQRNTTLNRCAFKVGRFVAWGDIPRHEVEEAFQAVGEARGLTAAECRTTIRSALDCSIRKARPRDAA
ncbi:bifunctional DNA primase/polymerase [Streptomyces caniferus]|uniref:Bifunctional DNA primase/polymerase n=1 Tax=Streptomyces caniferus TaxID=285557 RepID=A0ABZ1VQT2_9ACTN|nr:bifunctional DNA primase/polymerase [Streptomyces caniferus]